MKNCKSVKRECSTLNEWDKHLRQGPNPPGMSGTLVHQCEPSEAPSVGRPGGAERFSPAAQNTCGEKKIKAGSVPWLLCVLVSRHDGSSCATSLRISSHSGPAERQCASVCNSPLCVSTRFTGESLSWRGHVCTARCLPVKTQTVLPHRTPRYCSLDLHHAHCPESSHWEIRGTKEPGSASLIKWSTYDTTGVYA